MKKKNKSGERGNVFIIVLMGVILFATLAYVVSRGMRGETTGAMSKRQAELKAADILDYASRLERAVTKLRQQGVSESDLDFTNGLVAGYDHAQPDEHEIFNPAGGGVSWTAPPENANDGSDWLFTGGTCVVGVGAGGAGCDSNGVSDEELLAVVPNLLRPVCEEINTRLGIAAIPSGGSMSSSKFAGAFSEGNSPSGVDGETAACVEIGGDYYFYSVLLAR